MAGFFDPLLRYLDHACVEGFMALMLDDLRRGRGAGAAPAADQRAVAARAG